MLKTMFLNTVLQTALVIKDLVIRVTVPTENSRYTDNNPASRHKDTMNLIQYGSRIIDMFEHVVHQCRFEGSITKRQNISFHKARVKAFAAAVIDSPNVDIDADSMRTKRQHISNTATDIKCSAVQVAGNFRVKPIAPI